MVKANKAPSTRLQTAPEVSESSQAKAYLSPQESGTGWEGRQHGEHCQLQSHPLHAPSLFCCVVPLTTNKKKEREIGSSEGTTPERLCYDFHEGFAFDHRDDLQRQHHGDHLNFCFNVQHYDV